MQGPCHARIPEDVGVVVMITDSCPNCYNSTNHMEMQALTFAKVRSTGQAGLQMTAMRSDGGRHHDCCASVPVHYWIP